MPPVSDFAWDIKHYPTLTDYESALLPFQKPSWIKGICVHHTWKPTRAQWAGQRSMVSMGEAYEQKGWSAGPHLFLAALTRGPFTDGIWAGTPLAVPGVHAGGCNVSHIGVEVVGDYDVEVWPAKVADLVYGVVLLLMRWGNIPVTQVHGHRECLQNKSCPGSKIDMNVVRQTLAARSTPRYRLPRHPYYDRPGGTQLGYLSSTMEYGVLEIRDGWGRMRVDASDADGKWTPLTGLELVQ